MPSCFECGAEVSYPEVCRLIDREFEQDQCSNFDDRMYRFLCKEDKSELDAHLDFEVYTDVSPA